jgi:hypothetical protein
MKVNEIIDMIEYGNYSTEDLTKVIAASCRKMRSIADEWGKQVHHLSFGHNIMKNFIKRISTNGVEIKKEIKDFNSAIDIEKL